MENRNAMAKLKLAVLMLVIVLPLSTAARDLESDSPPRFWMDTIHGYQTEALPLVSCWPHGDDCETYADNIPSYSHPILEYGVIQIHMEGVVPARMVTLEVFRRIGDGALESTTVTVDADNPAITWDTDLVPGEYHLRITAEGAVDGRMTLALGIERLTNAEIRNNYPQPMPAVMRLEDGGVIEGLQGGYCFPPGEEPTRCLLYDAPPYPEAFHEIPANTVSIEMLGRPYPTRVGLWLHGREDWEVSESIEFESLNPSAEQLSFEWIPEDLPPGEYILTMLVDWGLEADASYYFGVTLTE
jgi:hypothetical protein